MALAQIPLNYNASAFGVLQNLSVVFGEYDLFLPNLISRLLLFAVAVSGFFFLAQLLTAGYAYLTSTGDPAKIQSATKTITHALLGLVVVFSTYFIIQILQAVFGINIL